MPVKLFCFVGFFLLFFWFFFFFGGGGCFVLWRDIIPKYLPEIAAINLGLTLLIGVDTL